MPLQYKLSNTSTYRLLHCPISLVPPQPRSERQDTAPQNCAGPLRFLHRLIAPL